MAGAARMTARRNPRLRQILTTGERADLAPSEGPGVEQAANHPMREVTRQIAFEPGGWTPGRADKVAALFDGLAAEWNQLDVAVLINMFLFRAELARVLRPNGVIVWISSIGDRTPIYLSAEDLLTALGPAWQGVASSCGEATWCVARR